MELSTWRPMIIFGINSPEASNSTATETCRALNEVHVKLTKDTKIPIERHLLYFPLSKMNRHHVSNVTSSSS